MTVRNKAKALQAAPYQKVIVKDFYEEFVRKPCGVARLQIERHSHGRVIITATKRMQPKRLRTSAKNTAVFQKAVLSVSQAVSVHLKDNTQ
jgi:DUF1365 family protein